MSARQISEQFAAFESEHGHKVETGLRALIEEMERDAIVAAGHYDAPNAEVAKEAATSYREALKAWLELCEVLP